MRVYSGTGSIECSGTKAPPPPGRPSAPNANTIAPPDSMRPRTDAVPGAQRQRRTVLGDLHHEYRWAV